VDWLIHDIDVCCWAKNAWPVSAQGQGGRQVRTEPDQMLDHCAVEYSFADGTRLVVQGRHIAGCWDCFGDTIHASKGSAALGSMVPNPRLYKGHLQTSENLIWQHRGPKCDYYQYEHDLLFEAIRQDSPYNETDRCARATLAAVLGRMTVESGKRITWDEAMASNLELAPGLDRYTMDSNPPVTPDAQGRYPIAAPGLTTVL
jgi:myo-inositol 2-dehydrogenase / D-chiro-inositol 1-dehydrogenase